MPLTTKQHSRKTMTSIATLADIPALSTLINSAQRVRTWIYKAIKGSNILYRMTTLILTLVQLKN